jgi:hypothetical protein
MNYSALTRTNTAPVGLLLIATIMLASCSDFRPAVPVTEAAPPAALTPQQQVAEGV